MAGFFMECLADWPENKNIVLSFVLKPGQLGVLLKNKSTAFGKTDKMASYFSGRCYNQASLLISSGVETCKINDLLQLVIIGRHLLSETR